MEAIDKDGTIRNNPELTRILYEEGIWASTKFAPLLRELDERVKRALVSGDGRTYRYIGSLGVIAAVAAERIQRETAGNRDAAEFADEYIRRRRQDAKGMAKRNTGLIGIDGRPITVPMG